MNYSFQTKKLYRFFKDDIKNSISLERFKNNLNTFLCKNKEYSEIKYEYLKFEDPYCYVSIFGKNSVDTFENYILNLKNVKIIDKINITNSCNFFDVKIIDKTFIQLLKTLYEMKKYFLLIFKIKDILINFKFINNLSNIVYFNYENIIRLFFLRPIDHDNAFNEIALYLINCQESKVKTSFQLKQDMNNNLNGLDDFDANKKNDDIVVDNAKNWNILSNVDDVNKKDDNSWDVLNDVDNANNWNVSSNVGDVNKKNDNSWDVLSNADFNEVMDNNRYNLKKFKNDYNFANDF